MVRRMLRCLIRHFRAHLDRPSWQYAAFNRYLHQGWTTRAGFCGVTSGACGGIHELIHELLPRGCTASPHILLPVTIVDVGQLLCVQVNDRAKAMYIARQFWFLSGVGQIAHEVQPNRELHRFFSELLGLSAGLSGIFLAALSSM